MALALPVFNVAMAQLVPAWSHAEWLSGKVPRWGSSFFWADWPSFGALLNPIIAGAAVSLSSFSVIANALRLRKTKL